MFEGQCVLVWLLFLKLHISGYRHSFGPACDIHANPNHGFSTPDDVLPRRANLSWLYPSLTDIERYYNKGMEECKAALYFKNFESYNLPDPYQFESDSHLCRGSGMLHRVSGKLAWIFGPLKAPCPTYSKCWIGVLTCGDTDMRNIQKNFVAEATKRKFKDSLPKFKRWSIGALHLVMRVGKGPETIVPEQRIVSLEKNHGEDVIIAQYVITKPHESYQLEVRQLELYLGALYEWTDEQKGYGLDMIGNIFLGGGESRCIPWTRCNVPYFCCGCDEKSFVSNSPILVRAPDGSSRCPVHPASLKLPLCPNLDSSRPGRWLNTEYPPTPSEKGCLKPYHSIITSPSDMKDLLSKGLIQNNTVRFPEISGDPCTVASAHPEEWGRSFWVYAPYTCRYHIYTRTELHQCLADQNISHIHIQGDSMSRDLFSAVASYLGVKMIEQDELKQMTNVLKEKRLMFNTGEVIVTLGERGSGLTCRWIVMKAEGFRIDLTYYCMEWRLG